MQFPWNFIANSEVRNEPVSNHVISDSAQNNKEKKFLMISLQYADLTHRLRGTWKGISFYHHGLILEKFK
jgi:hypothetical protein